MPKMKKISSKFCYSQKTSYLCNVKNKTGY